MVLSSPTSQFKVLDIERISERLFGQEKIRRNYSGKLSTARPARAI